MLEMERTSTHINNIQTKTEVHQIKATRSEFDLKKLSLCCPILGFATRESLTYSQVVYLLLLRRKRKLRFLISNFKHSTGLFELTLPYFTKVTCFARLISNLEQPRGCSSNLQLVALY